MMHVSQRVVMRMQCRYSSVSGKYQSLSVNIILLLVMT